MNKGKIFIVSGPSGVGKDSVLRELLSVDKDIEFSISCTTRNPRGNPVEDAKYRFISVDEFETEIKNNGFIEYATYCDNYYGTPRRPIEKWISEDKTILIECEVNGKKALADKLPDALTVFVLPPSIRTLRKRLEKRGTDSQDVIEARINKAKMEIPEGKKYDFLLINDDLLTSVEKLRDILYGNVEKNAQNEKIQIIEEVLNNV